MRAKTRVLARPKHPRARCAGTRAFSRVITSLLQSQCRSLAGRLPGGAWQIASPAVFRDQCLIYVNILIVDNHTCQQLVLTNDSGCETHRLAEMALDARPARREGQLDLATRRCGPWTHLASRQWTRTLSTPPSARPSGFHDSEARSLRAWTGLFRTRIGTAPRDKKRPAPEAQTVALIHARYSGVRGAISRAVVTGQP